MIRNKRKYHFIYKTTNLINKKFYIGMHSTDNLNDGYIGSGKRLRLSINKYGKENFKFEILEFLLNRDYLIQREKELVNEDLLKNSLCINILRGGGNYGIISKDLQIKLSIAGNAAQKKLWNENGEWATKMRKINSERMKDLHRKGKIKYDTFTNKHHSAKSIRKMKKSLQGNQVGNKNSQFGTCWINNGLQNKKIKRNSVLPSNYQYGRI